jgi:hypothetical protein
MMLNVSNFEIGFWHPFGPHGRESAEDIIERKRKEIETNGWTLWSFQNRKNFDDWERELSTAKTDLVFVFCSEGRGAVDPARDGSLSQPAQCKSFCFVGDTQWHPMPSGVSVPHPFRPGQNRASAFVVQRIIFPVEKFAPSNLEWFFQKNQLWDQREIPTRGEYLIRRGGTVRMRGVRAVLELKSPYLAIVAV